MTTLALTEQWTFAGVDLSTYARLVRSADGADSFPDLRGDDVPVPGIRGRRPLGKVFDSRRIALALFVRDVDDAGVAVGPTEKRGARTNLDALLAVIGRRTTASLVRTMPDGSTRTGTAEVVSAEATKEYGGAGWILVVDFQLADPFLYGASSATVQAIAASPTNFSITNVGTVAAEKIVLTFTGPITNPRLANLTLDAGGAWYVEALVSVAAATTLVIDAGKWTALNAGVEAIGSIRHSGGFPFFRLDPGVNSLRVTATTPGGSLTVAYSPAFL